eukprot:366268-Chlamydomonas_euryale.AAC.19
MLAIIYTVVCVCVQRPTGLLGSVSMPKLDPGTGYHVGHETLDENNTQTLYRHDRTVCMHGSRLRDLLSVALLDRCSTVHRCRTKEASQRQAL